MSFSHLPILRADVLDQIYDGDDSVFCQHHNNLDLNEYPVSIFEVCPMNTNGKQREGVSQNFSYRTIANIGVGNSRGFRCLLQDMSTRGYLELPPPSPGKKIIVDRVVVGPGLSDDDIVVLVNFVEMIQGWQVQSYYTYIRYELSWKENVLNVLKNRPRFMK
ncbi:hypothetical protein SCHPADRAFT_893054 [Schizopora paradoxa]|uniref:Uncharacterized protein n=1 Tax=Schizopora paradoxa TaxID=27342 RepID=A0A0H2RJC0_9AGAM|nr:hypothetical protein SCHPADRAFT_893054 [Schizopora paradoxa]